MNYPKESWKDIGKKISLARQRKRISQYDLANKVGFSQTWMANVEHGRTIPDSDTFDAILKAIGMTRDELAAVKGIPILKRDGKLLNIPPEYQEVAEENTFGYQVRIAREALGLTQYKLSQESGVSRNYICEIEKGYKANVSWDVWQKLNKVLNFDTSNEPLPTGLEEYAIAVNLNEEDVSMLRGVHYFGSQPETVEGWRRLHEAIMFAIAEGPSEERLEEAPEEGDDVLQVEIGGELLEAINETLERSQPYANITIEEFVEYIINLFVDYGDVFVESLKQSQNLELRVGLTTPTSLQFAPARVDGQKIRDLREGAGLSLEELSGRVGIKSLSKLSRVERGIVRAKQKDVEAIAQALGVSVEQLSRPNH